jgi:polyphenol oxidase
MRLENFEIEQPAIFPKGQIISGITKKNESLFPPNGFSVAPANILTEEEYIKNQIYLADFLNTEPDLLKFQKQVHGNVINIIDESSGIQISDGMICNKPGVFICLKIADCCAILIYDPVNKVIAGLHSGWRGTNLNIAETGIKILKERYGARPDDLIVYLSPAASGNRYEVGWDVAKHFQDAIIKKSDTKYLFDNKLKIKTQLIECGIPEKNIEVSNLCTIENPEFHSFRRDGIKSGRMAAYISMK